MNATASAESSNTIAAICDDLQHLDGALLPILNEVQNQLGHIPDSAVGVIAERLHLSRAEVHGVVSFYHRFRQSPGKTHQLLVCCAEACRSVGAADVMEKAKSLIGTPPFSDVDLAPVYCLGQCACGPAIEFDGQIRVLVDENEVVRLLHEQLE